MFKKLGSLLERIIKALERIAAAAETIANWPSEPAKAIEIKENEKALVSREGVVVPEAKIEEPLPPTKFVSLKDARKKLEAYKKEFKAFRKQQPANRNVGTEVEYVEGPFKNKGVRTDIGLLKTEEFRGVDQVEAFIRRANKDEVRLVRQLR